ncbi:hypothetical protein [Hymenobacter sp. 102]|uniref:hypothetical protein n=1 Tax=Hymenobacter sp. 102 TaxID=3403152 RepID=UPI003CF18568
MRIGLFILIVFRVVKYSFSFLALVGLLLVSPYHEEHLLRTTPGILDEDSNFLNLLFSILMLGVHLPVSLWRLHYAPRSRLGYTELGLGIGFALMVAKWGYWATCN